MAGAGFTPAPAGGQQPQRFAGAHVRPDWDPIEALPPAAADRLRLLRQRAKDHHALIPPFEDVRTASLERVNAERELQRLRDPAQDGGFNLPVDAPQVIAAQRTLDMATDAFTRLQELQATRSAAWQASGRVLSVCETYLRDGRPGGAALEAVEVDPQLAKGEKGLLDAVENRRRRGRELKADAAQHQVGSVAIVGEAGDARAGRGARSARRA